MSGSCLIKTSGETFGMDVAVRMIHLIMRLWALADIEMMVGRAIMKAHRMIDTVEEKMSRRDIGGGVASGTMIGMVVAVVKWQGLITIDEAVLARETGTKAEIIGEATLTGIGITTGRMIIVMATVIEIENEPLTMIVWKRRGGKSMRYKNVLAV